MKFKQKKLMIGTLVAITLMSGGYGLARIPLITNKNKNDIFQDKNVEEKYFATSQNYIGGEWVKVQFSHKDKFFDDKSWWDDETDENGDITINIRKNIELDLSKFDGINQRTFINSGFNDWNAANKFDFHGHVIYSNEDFFDKITKTQEKNNEKWTYSWHLFDTLNNISIENLTLVNTPFIARTLNKVTLENVNFYDTYLNSFIDKNIYTKNSDFDNNQSLGFFFNEINYSTLIDIDIKNINIAPIEHQTNLKFFIGVSDAEPNKLINLGIFSGKSNKTNFYNTNIEKININVIFTFAGSEGPTDLQFAFIAEATKTKFFNQTITNINKSIVNPKSVNLKEGLYLVNQENVNDNFISQVEIIDSEKSWIIDNLKKEFSIYTNNDLNNKNIWSDNEALRRDINNKNYVLLMQLFKQKNDDSKSRVITKIKQSSNFFLLENGDLLNEDNVRLDNSKLIETCNKEDLKNAIISSLVYKPAIYYLDENSNEQKLKINDDFETTPSANIIQAVNHLGNIAPVEDGTIGTLFKNENGKEVFNFDLERKTFLSSEIKSSLKISDGIKILPEVSNLMIEETVSKANELAGDPEKQGIVFNNETKTNFINQEKNIKLNLAIENPKDSKNPIKFNDIMLGNATSNINDISSETDVEKQITLVKSTFEYKQNSNGKEIFDKLRINLSKDLEEYDTLIENFNISIFKDNLAAPILKFDLMENRDAFTNDLNGDQEKWSVNKVENKTEIIYKNDSDFFKDIINDGWTTYKVNFEYVFFDKTITPITSLTDEVTFGDKPIPPVPPEPQTFDNYKYVIILSIFIIIFIIIIMSFTLKTSIKQKRN